IAGSGAGRQAAGGNRASVLLGAVRRHWRWRAGRRKERHLVTALEALAVELYTMPRRQPDGDAAGGGEREVGRKVCLRSHPWENTRSGVSLVAAPWEPCMRLSIRSLSGLSRSRPFGSRNPPTTNWPRKSPASSVRRKPRGG